MKTIAKSTFKILIASTMLWLLPVNLQAWEPNANDLDTAIQSGDFTGYFGNISTWLSQKVPADPGKISEATTKALLKNPVFANTLDQRQLLSKLGVDKIGAFAKADPANRGFLAWLLKNTQAMDLFLEAAGPTAIADRAKNRYKVSTSTLDIWRKILRADPDARGGIYQRLAIATAIAPPGSRTRGAGWANPPADPVGRYKHFKSAYKHKELFPRFANLTVWEYTKVVSCHASDSDLAWARKMINTWRPDLRIKEQVVNSTSEVQYRKSPVPYTDFRAVMEGGGSCGPRSSWAVMICQAFGIPTIGVSQPRHACVAYKALDPSMQPQPGKVWKVGYGRAWKFSKLDGTSGPLFLEAVQERALAEFSQIEHLRWLASTLAAKEAAEAVRAIANKIRESAPPPTPAPAPAPAPAIPEKPFKAAPGVIHVEAEAFSKMSGVRVYDCFTGGKQVNFQKNRKTSWVDYTLEVPATGTYGMTMRIATPNRDQILDIRSGDNKLATLKIPNTTGLWTTTEAVELKLNKGTQTLRISAPYQRGIAVRWFELKSK